MLFTLSVDLVKVGLQNLTQIPRTECIFGIMHGGIVRITVIRRDLSKATTADHRDSDILITVILNIGRYVLDFVACSVDYVDIT
ncbi:hypothetical protein A2U01_0079430, partial [Trifolium medium]|nr:hypothetical protein [Trifolium medium]